MQYSLKILKLFSLVLHLKPLFRAIRRVKLSCLDSFIHLCICMVLFFQKGRICEHKYKFTEAKQYYESAIALNPFHTKTLHRLVCISCILESPSFFYLNLVAMKHLSHTQTKNEKNGKKYNFKLTCYLVKGRC